jgi:hypothetical protein
VPRLGSIAKFALFFEGTRAVRDLLRFVEATELADRTAELPEVALEKRELLHRLKPFAEDA